MPAVAGLSQSRGMARVAGAVPSGMSASLHVVEQTETRHGLEPSWSTDDNPPILRWHGMAHGMGISVTGK